MDYSGMTFDELNARKRKAQETVQNAKIALGEIEEAIYNQFDSVNFAEMVGRCFYYDNSYGGDDEEWKEYTKILSYDKESESFRVFRFFYNSHEIVEKILTEPADYYSKDSCLRFKDIDEEEFMATYRIFTSRVDELLIYGNLR